MSNAENHKFTNAERFILLKRLLADNFSENRNKYIVAILSMIVLATMTSLTAWILGDVIDTLFVEKDFTKTIWIGVAVFSIFTTRGLSAYLIMLMLTRIGANIIARIQRQIYRHMLVLGMEFFDANESSDTITKMSQVANNARDTINLLTTSFFRDLLSVIGLAVVMIVKQPFLAFIVFFFVPIGILGLQSLAKKITKQSYRHYESGVELIRAVQEGVRGILTIKSFGLEDSMNRRMAHSANQFAERAVKVAMTDARSIPIVDILSGIAIASVIVYTGWRTTFHGETPGPFVAFIGALLLAYEPAKRLARLRIKLEGNLVSVRLLYELLNLPPSETECKEGKLLSISHGKIEMSGIQFSYRDGVPALADISLNIEGGSRVALVGESGSGKSTIAKLLMRLYTPDAGYLKIDGQDISKVSTASLRSQIAFVSQDSFQFSGSIGENIRLGRPDASDEEVRNAAERAQAAGFINALPNGYDSNIGEDGVMLSGGQLQRVAIARAILKDAPIILLDEATSALDSESESQVQESLDELLHGRTTIAIAHRLATVRQSNLIYALRAGIVVESGTHDELIEKDGYYAILSRLQFGPEMSNST